MRKKTNKAVVTGGAGFIGSHIVDELISRGFEVHIIDNLSGGNVDNINSRAELHTCDIRDLSAITPIISGSQYVFHEAALPRVQFSIENPIDTHNTNVNGTLNVLIASHNGGVKKVVYAASSSAYGDQVTMPLHEDMSASPLSPYGLQKHIGELKCRVWSKVYGLPTISLRYFNVYGPRASHTGAYALVIAKFLRQRSEDEPMTITGDGEQTRDYTHVRDVVRANILAATNMHIGNGEVINIGAGDSATVNRIAELIGGDTKHIPPRLEPKHTLADNLRAKNMIGWEPRITLEEGIEELKSLYNL